MECYYHPSRESTDNCAICNKSICKECGLEIAGKVYCKECVEKIVGLGISEKQPQPTRLEKETPESQIEMANLIKNKENEMVPKQKFSNDSPYNIRDNIQYEGGVDSVYDIQPKQTLDQAIEANQGETIPERPVRDVREEYLAGEPIQQARNEYDYIEPQKPAADDYIYPDHSYEPQETTARRSLEEKYERYLDDLYYDEEEIPLNEQLARDEAKFGSLTRNEYHPRNTHEKKTAADDELDRRIRSELAKREHRKYNNESIHNIEYKEEKEPFSAVDIILTIILIIVILVVVYYIIYLLFLSASYPTFTDAIFALRNPGNLIRSLS